MAATPSDWFRRTLELTRGSVVRVSLARFVLLSALALLVLGVGIRTAGRHIAEEQALEEATDRATGRGQGHRCRRSSTLGSAPETPTRSSASSRPSATG